MTTDTWKGCPPLARASVEAPVADGAELAELDVNVELDERVDKIMAREGEDELEGDEDAIGAEMDEETGSELTRPDDSIGTAEADELGD